MRSSVTSSLRCCVRTSRLSRRIAVVHLLAAAVVIGAGTLSHAVEVSASYNSFQAVTNHMGLPVSPGVFNPGSADFGTAGLVAPGSGTNTDTVSFAYPANAPNAGNAVQMYGDAISSITNLGSGSFQVELTLTNFFIDQGTPQLTKEYVYLNVWETFTGLGLPANVIWSTSGTISVNGIWSAGVAGFVAIEPTAIVFDPGPSMWDQASPFFGDTGTGPGGGALSDSQAVNALTSYVSAGQLILGVQTILQLQDLPGNGGAMMHLPSSLDLSVTLTPVEVPEPSTLALAGAAMILLGRQAIRHRRKRAAPRG